MPCHHPFQRPVSCCMMRQLGRNVNWLVTMRCEWPPVVWFVNLWWVTQDAKGMLNLRNLFVAQGRQGRTIETWSSNWSSFLFRKIDTSKKVYMHYATGRFLCIQRNCGFSCSKCTSNFRYTANRWDHQSMDAGCSSWPIARYCAWGPVGLIGRDMGAMEEDNEMLTHPQPVAVAVGERLLTLPRQHLRQGSGEADSHGDS